MKKISIILFLVFTCIKISAQNIVDNLDMFLSTQYIESDEYIYIYLEILINNRNQNSIFLLKDYDFVNIIEEEDGNILFLSSWVDRIDNMKNSSALYHNPRMIEIRNMQVVYVPIFLKIPNSFTEINKNRIINKIDGLKYSLVEYITEDISWAKNVDEFALNILGKVDDLKFNYNKHTHKYGGIIVSQIKPPEWMLGTWKTDGAAFLGSDTIKTTARSLNVTSDDILQNNESLHGWLITRIENTITQSYGDNTYNLDIAFVNGRIDYYHFTMDNGYLIMNHSNHNGLFAHRFERE
jgi:hypothetical protein